MELVCSHESNHLHERILTSYQILLPSTRVGVWESIGRHRAVDALPSKGSFPASQHQDADCRAPSTVEVMKQTFRKGSIEELK